MTAKDSMLLSEAYLSIKKKLPTTSTDAPTNEVSTAPNETVSVGPMNAPAPGVTMDLNTSPADNSSEQPVAIGSASEPSVMQPGMDCDRGGVDYEQEEAHEMALDNLNSIRESIMKIADHCAAGEHLPAWSLQKLAIAMDNLADVARAVR